ncbi:hypothetical protein ZIOFF_018042 [Zingiber officinale]|uniref:Uncharacterized protein n=1 Tax=Zingiber officinale TaxID=94328 RepID=A0A8J5LAN5_ZINOF|nr:hypothetical protein ZIOFF_018042 [Zingiber officinale]
METPNNQPASLLPLIIDLLSFSRLTGAARIGGGLSFTVRQRQQLAPVTSSDPPPMSSSPRSGGNSGKFFSCITSDASSNLEQASLKPDEETDQIKPWTTYSSARGWESGSEAWVDECALSLAGEGSPSDVETIESHIVVIERSPSDVETIESHIVVIERVIQNELPRWKKVLIQENMIYRIPEITRSLDKDAYAPRFVSFGPYHRDTEALRLADNYKWLFLRQILNMNEEVSLMMYLKEMNGVTQNVKGCYEEDMQMETNDGIKMLLLDGCCILVAEESTLEKCLSGHNKMREDVICQEQDELVSEASSSLESLSELLDKLLLELAGLASRLESKSTADLS